MPLIGNPWALLIAAIGLEVIGTMLLKMSDGFAKWHLGLAAIGLYAICFWALATVLRSIPVGVAYAIWSGVGIVGITAIGAIMFGERLGGMQMACIGLILAGAVGLQLTTTSA